MDMEYTDVLVDILRHLPPCSLAASRRVCTTWRATVDHHRLLRADLLPLSLDAVIYEKVEMEAPILFSRRSTARYITSRLDYLEEDPAYGEYAGEMKDHCNGLLVIQNDVVVNPATRQWARLPPLPCACSWPATTMSCGRCHNNRYIIYDPTMSAHYEVFFIPRIPRDVPAGMACTTEWPPSSYVMHVFSSRTKCWKQRSFAREGDAPGTIEDVISCWKSDKDLYYAAYWHGSLYVPCRQRQADFLLRINLSNDKYKVIKLPKGCRRSQFRLGKSKNGVYCVLHIDGRCQFQVWLLDESRGLIDWVLKNEINLEPAWRKYSWNHSGHGPWILQTREETELLLESDVNLALVEEYNEAVAKDGFEWHSDDENTVGVTDWPEKGSPDDIGAPIIGCLGFHPYKEIVLFHEYDGATVAYHLNSSKVQYLGKMEHRYSDIEISFAYAPCWTRDLPGSN